jgi:hypothetical protein
MELQLPGDFEFEIGAGKRMSHSIPLRQMQMPSAKRKEAKESPHKVIQLPILFAQPLVLKI